MVANQMVSDQLVLGNSYQEKPSRGVKKSFSFKYIDFENSSHNIFHFTEEFSVSRVTQNERMKTRRPDIVLFVNGIPFGVVELKKSAITTQEGVSQMIRNQDREEDNNVLEKYVKNRAISRLDKTLYSLFEPKRALKLMHSFILFDGKIKKIARYQQYFAIQEIMNKIERLDATGRLH